MSERLDYMTASPEAYRAMERLHKYVEGCGLEHSLLEFVKIRASQINGCAYCLAMHARDARKAGEREIRIDLLPAWREAPPSLYTPRERAALAMTEAMTLIANDGVPDDVYAMAEKEFSADELVKLAVAIVLINGWNRICVTFRSEPEV